MSTVEGQKPAGFNMLELQLKFRLHGTLGGGEIIGVTP